MVSITKPAPRIGQIYQDLHEDEHYYRGPNKRRIEIVEVSSDYVRAKVLCDGFGAPYVNRRLTRMMLKTLRAGYRLCE